MLESISHPASSRIFSALLLFTRTPVLSSTSREAIWTLLMPSLDRILSFVIVSRFHLQYERVLKGLGRGKHVGP